MLCSVCEAFDIRTLYGLAKHRRDTTKPKEPGGGGFPEYAGFPMFFKHHNNLNALRESVKERCLLCKAIWHQFRVLLPPDLWNDNASLPDGEFDQPVFLGLSHWSPEAQGFPYLNAIQNLPRSVVRSLAHFDVYAEQGKSVKF